MKILVVEDEERLAKNIKKGLELERNIVSIAFDGEAGFDLATEEDFDLILLDIMLPYKDGVTFCRELREKHINTPVLMLTAKGQVDEKVIGLDAGADDYLTKPFSFDELFARVRALARRPSETVTNTMSVLDLQLNQETFEVSRNKIPIQLSQKEFLLLKFLMQKANTIVSKEKIMSQVWDDDADILPNTIEANIKNLRKKIDYPFADFPPLIHTVRGFGYRIGK